MNVNRINYANMQYGQIGRKNSVNFKQKSLMKKVATPMAAVLLAIAPISCSKDDGTTLTPEERQKADSLKHYFDSLKNATQHEIDSIKKVIEEQKDSIKNKSENAK